MKKLIIILCTLFLTACTGIAGDRQTPGQTSVVQRIFSPPDKVDKIEFGMTRRQVVSQLGAPRDDSAAEADRLYYIFVYENERGRLGSSELILYFRDNALVRAAGTRKLTALIEDEANQTKH